jgi:penicillin-binding protein 1A
VRLVSGETVVLRGDGLRGVQAALAPKAPRKLAISRGSIVRVVQLPEAPAARAKGKGSETHNGGKAAESQAGAKGGEWQIAQWPQADGAFVALDPVSGHIRALVGGFDFNRQNFNHATSAARQPGSSLKPFLYSAAFEHGVMPETLVEDAPLTAPDGGPAAWDPQNSDGLFDGEISVREALVRSKNLVSVRLLQHIGLPAARDWIARFGFDPAHQPQDLTLALGTGSVTPLQLAQAYAVLANGGHRVLPVLVERISNARGDVLYQAAAVPPLDDNNRVVPARNVFLVNSLLADVTLRGTAARAQATLQRPDLYGKTGTTNEAVDAWFGGHAPGVAAVAWIGYDEPRSLGESESGGGLALPVWIDTMKTLLRGVPVKSLEPPPGLLLGTSDWRYEELAEGGVVERIGEPVPSAPPEAPASAASR